MATFQTVVDEVVAQLDFADDSLETLVETAFIAGGNAMIALLAVDKANETLETPQDLTDYVGGIAGLTQNIGGFLHSLTPEQEATYRANLKKVITNPVPEIETALEAFADSNLDLAAALLDVNAAIDDLSGN